MMGVNSLPKTLTRQLRDCDLNPGPSVPEPSTLTTRLPSHPNSFCLCNFQLSRGWRNPVVPAAVRGSFNLNNVAA